MICSASLPGGESRSLKPVADRRTRDAKGNAMEREMMANPQTMDAPGVARASGLSLSPDQKRHRGAAVSNAGLANLRMQDDDGGDKRRDGKDGKGGSDTGVVTRVKPKTKKPSLFRVLLLNDDYTPMEFVIHVLERFFGKSRDAATQIMLHVHHHGIGECGIYTYEVAETKVTQVMDFARKHQHPLQCVMEKN